MLLDLSYQNKKKTIQEVQNWVTDFCQVIGKEATFLAKNGMWLNETAGTNGHCAINVLFEVYIGLWMSSLSEKENIMRLK